MSKGKGKKRDSKPFLFKSSKFQSSFLIFEIMENSIESLIKWEESGVNMRRADPPLLGSVPARIPRLHTII